MANFKIQLKYMDNECCKAMFGHFLEGMNRVFSKIIISTVYSELATVW